MGEHQHELLRNVLHFQFQDHPQYPVSEERLAALNRYIKNRSAELLKIPVVNETNLRNILKEEARKINGAVPLLEQMTL